MEDSPSLLELFQISDSRGNLVYFENNSQVLSVLRSGFLINSEEININNLTKFAERNILIICLSGFLDIKINKINFILDCPHKALFISDTKSVEINLNHIDKNSKVLITNWE